jgi:hypothetical protein
MSTELSIERIGDLLAGVGNHEGKALLVLTMDTGEAYALTALWHLLTARTNG